MIYCVLSHNHTNGGGDDAVEEWQLATTIKERLLQVHQKAARKRSREEKGGEVRKIAKV